MPSENTSMNKELRKWIKESKEKIKVNKSKEIEHKKISGNCQVCGRNEAEAICLKCKRMVCKSCYFKIMGVCKKCIPKDIAGKWDGSVPDWEKKLGVDWVE
jgi:hypothetical protein